MDLIQVATGCRPCYEFTDTLVECAVDHYIRPGTVRSALVTQRRPFAKYGRLIKVHRFLFAIHFITYATNKSPSQFLAPKESIPKLGDPVKPTKALFA
jgi:hypothetical protein